MARGGVRPLRRWHGRTTGRLALGCVFGLGAVAIHSVGDFGIHMPAIALLTAVVAAQLMAAAEGEAPARGASLRRRARRTPGGRAGGGGRRSGGSRPGPRRMGGRSRRALSQGGRADRARVGAGALRVEHPLAAGRRPGPTRGCAAPTGVGQSYIDAFEQERQRVAEQARIRAMAGWVVRGPDWPGACASQLAERSLAPRRSVPQPRPAAHGPAP